MLSLTSKSVPLLRSAASVAPRALGVVSPVALARDITTTPKDLGLEAVGINSDAVVYRNLSYEEIFEHEVKNEEGVETKNGTFSVDTGVFTGRSPQDKYFVKQAPSEDNIWWGPVNKPVSPELFEKLHAKVTARHGEADKLYVFDGFCGSNPETRKAVRFVTEMAWQHHFVTNMFIRPTAEELVDFKPQFTVLNGCKTSFEGYEAEGMNSDVFVAFNIEKSMAVIGGTYYGGEMKKGIFSMMHYWQPLDGIMTMHCSANKGPDGDVAVFFGLSGTGKTTLSADPKRELIGDDEHLWDSHGTWNMEGGCYAKTIGLEEENEPEIYAAIKRNALLENVTLKEDGSPDYYNTVKTENGRVSYPIFHIPNHEPTSSGGHPNVIVFLTADAFSVLPPVAKLDADQAMYHFLSGYTAKVAGTERGITEPQSTFSACFGSAFLPLHPTKYADLLKDKMNHHETRAYLVNTGWSGGPYGTGSRISLKHTRKCIDAILDGSIEDMPTRFDERFQFEVPTEVAGVPAEIFNPRGTWADGAAYDDMANDLARQFIDNYAQYQEEGMTDYSHAGPRIVE